MERDAKWIDAQFWVCLRHFSPPRMHMIQGKCFHPKCNTVRPRKTTEELLRDGESIEKFSVAIKTNQVKKAMKNFPQTDTKDHLCAWKRCTRLFGKRDLRRERSKYCSEDCRKAYARDAYKQRQKAKK